MLELHTQKRTKVHLPDYPYQQDILNRILLSDLTPSHFRVLEELIFSPLKVSIKKLARSVDLEESDLQPILNRFAATRLIQIDQETLLIDKERRKYFEFQISRFEEGFKPDMEFLQGLLRQVPIQVLPTWYSIPRTSNNIFESIVERYLQTPHAFQRYLSELHFSNPQLHAIVNDLFESPDLRLSSSDLIARYNLPRETFEEMMLQLEYNFIACVSYIREEDHWHEVITPFHEWRQYLQHLRDTEVKAIDLSETILRMRESDFAFVEDMAALLKAAKKRPLPLSGWDGGAALPPPLVAQIAPVVGFPLDEYANAKGYLSHLLSKLILLKFAELLDGRLYALEGANDWLDLDSQAKALHLYRHPLNRLLSHPSAQERQIREAEKAIKRIADTGWVYVDDYLKSAIVPLGEDSVVHLKRSGKQWRYTLPVYSEEEQAILKAVACEWLFECGMIATGTHLGRECLTVTPYGSTFFES